MTSHKQTIQESHTIIVIERRTGEESTVVSIDRHVAFTDINHVRKGEEIMALKCEVSSH